MAITKESRDVATVDLSGFLLQIEIEDNRILLKSTGVVALLLVESKKHLVKKIVNRQSMYCVISVSMAS